MNNQYIKLLIVFATIFLPLQGISAQDMPSVDGQNNIKTTDNTNTDIMKDNEQSTDVTSAEVTEDKNQQNLNNEAGPFEVFNLNNKANNSDVKPKSGLNDNKKNLLNLETFTLKPKDKVLNDKQPVTYETLNIKVPSAFSRILRKYHLDFTTLLAILGLLGTFLGLLSTWTIYLLNKKNSDPLFIDKKHSAIKYIEAIDKIKESINKANIKKLDILLDNLLNGSLSPSESEELINLMALYVKYTVSISKVPLLDIHDHYKKHINPRNIDNFNSFIALYKMIEVDGKFYGEIGEIVDYKTLESMKFFTEDSAAKWKQKIITLLAIDEKALIIKKIIFKNLKR